MQLRKDQFYKKLNERFGVEEELAHSVCDFIFKRWNEWQRLPDNLRLNVKHFGVFHLRHKEGRRKYKNMVRKDYDYENKENNKFRGPKDESIYERHKNFLERITYLLDEVYPQYLKEKKEIQEERAEQAVLREPITTPLMFLKPVKPIEE